MYEDLNRPPLNAVALRRALVDRPEGPWSAIEVRDRTGSTNADVAAAARDGAAEGLVVVAEVQDAGRGRIDRQWVSPPRAGLTFSVLLRPAGVPVERRAWIPLLAGVATARAVGALGGVEAAVKWPNDLLIGGDKAAGLLAEVVGDAVVLGIGLNVTTRRDELPRADTTSLALAGSTVVDRDTVLRAVLRALGTDYDTWRLHAGDPDASGLRAAYRESCDTLGREVRVSVPGGADVLGKAEDVDVDGRLVVATATGSVVVAAGDVVHVRPV